MELCGICRKVKTDHFYHKALEACICEECMSDTFSIILTIAKRLNEFISISIASFDKVSTRIYRVDTDNSITECPLYGKDKGKISKL